MLTCHAHRFGDVTQRHRGIEATFVHLDSGVYVKVVFHTPATCLSTSYCEFRLK